MALILFLEFDVGRKAKTHGQFVEELLKVNPDITVLGEYVGSVTKLHVRHTCGHSWSVTPSHLLRGTGCPKCGGSEKKTHERFVAELAELSPDITVLGKYLNAETKMQVRHTCGYQWGAAPRNLIFGMGCPKCGRNAKKTHEQFVAELNKVSPDIAVLGEYTNSYTKLQVKHTCGYQWNARPNSLLRGCSCPKCGGSEKKTHEQFVAELNKVSPDIAVLGEYTNSYTKLQVKHTCGYQWSVAPDNLLRGKCCPKCAVSGYKPDKKGYFYSYAFESYLGFGITNVPKNRLRTHRMTFKKLGIEATLMQTFSGDGKAIQDLETHLKRTLPIVNTGVDGFKTEAILWGDRELLFKACEDFQRSHSLKT